jgi:hypothetical protein
MAGKSVAQRNGFTQRQRAQRNFVLSFFFAFFAPWRDTNFHSMTENEIAKILVDIFLKVHRALGPGLLESVYEEAICYELETRGMSFSRQKGIAAMQGFHAKAWKMSRKGAKGAKKIQIELCVLCALA